DELDVVRTSKVYETVAVGPPQPDYLNAVAEIATTLPPRALLAILQSIEREIGRTPTERWGQREIDLDLLLYGDESIEQSDLVVPHSELTKRAFVLVPLAEIAADASLPDGSTVAGIVAGVDTAGVRVSATSTTRTLAGFGIVGQVLFILACI